MEEEICSRKNRGKIDLGNPKIDLVEILAQQK